MSTSLNRTNSAAPTITRKLPNPPSATGQTMLQKSISHLTIPPYLRKTAAVLSVLSCIAALGYAVLTLTGGGAISSLTCFTR